MRITISVVCIALMGVLASAGEASTATEPAAQLAAVNTAAQPVEEFSNTFTTQREVFDVVEAALASGDVDALRALAVTGEEFRDLVWPTLDVAKLPNSNFTAEFVWSQHQLKHEKCLLRTSHDYEGQQFDIVDISFLGKSSDHGSFQIHRDSEITIMRPDGSREKVQLFGSLLETDDGRYKIYSFIND